MHPGNRALLQSGTIDRDAIKRSEFRIHEARQSPNTRKAYASAWRAFSSWCDVAQVVPLPADPGTVRDFTTWCLNHGYRLKTVALRLCAIVHRHVEAGCASPVDRALCDHMANAKRHLKERPAGKAAMSYDLLRRMTERFPETPKGIRNRAMILLTFACGWRRSETVALEYMDVHMVPQGMQLWLRASKTDQKAEGRMVGIEPGVHAVTCPVAAMRAWLAVRGSWPGALFSRMSAKGEVMRTGLHWRGGVIHSTVKQSMEAIGEDPKRFGAHSLRVGMITESIHAGASETAIMQRTGHKRYESLRRYVRPAQVFCANPLKGVL